MSALVGQVYLTLRWAMRDRLFYAVLGVAVGMLLLVPVFSSFSMRQVQELALTLSLSVLNLCLIVSAVLLGTSSVWREIEKKYTTSVLSLPLSRFSYLLSKFIGICLFLALTTIMLFGMTALVVTFAASTYPSSIPVPWGNLVWAFIFTYLKSVLLASFAIFFSSLGTSFFLPFFTTFAVYLAGNSSQEVFEYVTGDYGETLSQTTILAAKTLYYLLPNLSAFDLQVYAIYGLELPGAHLALTLAYFAVYTAIILCFSMVIYRRRQLA